MYFKATFFLLCCRSTKCFLSWRLRARSNEEAQRVFCYCSHVTGNFKSVLRAAWWFSLGEKRKRVSFFKWKFNFSKNIFFNNASLSNVMLCNKESITAIIYLHSNLKNYRLQFEYQVYLIVLSTIWSRYLSGVLCVQLLVPLIYVS